MRSMMALLLVGGALALPACNKNQNADQNIVITNDIPANADVEALPPDESVGTSTNELINGQDNPDVNDLGNNTTG